MIAFITFGILLASVDCDDQKLTMSCRDYNAERQSCPSACQPTCANPTYEFCTDNCNPDECVCIAGYVKNNGTCTKIENCPDNLGCNGDRNSMITSCASYCPETCEQRTKKSEPTSCIAACKSPGCACKPGFVLSEEQGRCISDSECETSCNGDYNAERQSCPSSCQPTCANPTYDFCTADCNPDECVCKSGYVKNNGECIKIEDCPDNLGCNGDINARITSCGSYCPETCEQRNMESEPKFCIALCRSPSCACKPGFVSSEEQGRCISDAACELSKKPEKC